MVLEQPQLAQVSSSPDTPSPEKKAALYNESSFIHADVAADDRADKKLTADVVEVSLSAHISRSSKHPWI